MHMLRAFSTSYFLFMSPPKKDIEDRAVVLDWRIYRAVRLQLFCSVPLFLGRAVPTSVPYCTYILDIDFSFIFAGVCTHPRSGTGTSSGSGTGANRSLRSSNVSMIPDFVSSLHIIVLCPSLSRIGTTATWSGVSPPYLVCFNCGASLAPCFFFCQSLTLPLLANPSPFGIFLI